MCDRKKVTAPLFEEGIINQDGVVWKQSRDMLRPHFRQGNYADCSIFKTPVDKLLETQSARRGVVDLQPLFFDLTLDVSISFLFGISLSELECNKEEDMRLFGESFDIAQGYIAKRYRLGGLYWLINSRKFRHACKVVHDTVDLLIHYSLHNERQQEGRDSLIHILRQRTENRADLHSQVINLLVAGRDTTACLLSWTLSVFTLQTVKIRADMKSFLLVRHPQVLAKLREESALHGKEEFTRASLRNMSYLQNVLKESKSSSQADSHDQHD